MPNEDVEDAADDSHGLALQNLSALLHIDHLSFVLSFQDDQGDFDEGSQGSENILQHVHLHALGIVSNGSFFTDYFQLSQEDSMIEEEEQHREEVLQNGQDLQD